MDTWVKVALVAETLPDWPQTSGDKVLKLLADRKQVGLLFILQENEMESAI